jgi:hypothetical protein
MCRCTILLEQNSVFNWMIRVYQPPFRSWLLSAPRIAVCESFCHLTTADRLPKRSLSKDWSLWTVVMIKGCSRELINSMELRTNREAPVVKPLDSFSAFHGTRRLIHKSSPPVPIFSQTNPVHITPSHLSETHPNIIHPPTSWSPLDSFSAFHGTRRLIHKSSPPVPILSQTNPVHITPSHLSEIHPNIIHPPVLVFLPISYL